LKSGIHPKVASKRLGHGKVGITLDLYFHVLPGIQEDAAAKVDATLKQPIGSPRNAQDWPTVALILRERKMHQFRPGGEDRVAIR